ncbi:hypothetical protein BU26DRAFT_559307 [Trematosphaeria pertusa]|uniref:BTB domain-containing protein n=1 Tax=Trematosphaeria pertusa TaxID=390896 RepID=A0A6A6IW93_9PLEO|nr:uncharacterized protein BU26DRAFT_559307 [Trematosphaeria pertusa]KAF2254636.1 hypothetical protein BU26DRAFT_559307 [Trematosphaeria pertusa]
MAPSFAEELHVRSAYRKVTLTLCRRLHTRPFTFIIGEDETLVYEHGGIISALSAPLDRLINGPMGEGQSGIVIFPELEVGDFERICEFAYRGDYKPPAPTRFLDTEVDIGNDMWLLDGALQAASPAVNDSGIPAERQRERERDREDELYQEVVPLSGTTRKEYFEGIDCPGTGNTQAEIIQSFSAHGNRSWRENFAPVLLGHSRLYAFAEQYLIPELKQLAFAKLKLTLTQYTPFVSSLDTVNQLAQFAYDKVYIQNRAEGRVDPLRQLVVAFIVMHHGHFRDSTVHRELMESAGEYATDVLDLIGRWFDY